MAGEEGETTPSDRLGPSRLDKKKNYYGTSFLCDFVETEESVTKLTTTSVFQYSIQTERREYDMRPGQR